MNLVTGGVIEIGDYNDLALEVNRLFSDNTTSLDWLSSNIILSDTVGVSGEPAGATRTLSPEPTSSEYLVITLDGVTLALTEDYTISYTSPVTITFIDPLPANAVITVWNRDTHRYGWGQQASVYPISSGDPILADEAVLQAYLEANINNLIDKTNIMEDRTDGPSELTRIAQGAVIFASDKTTITSTIDADILVSDNYWQNALVTVNSNVSSFTRTTEWNNILVGEMRHSWDSYDSARYFFNSGNEIRAAISLTGDALNQGFNNWNQVADAMGTLSLNYTTCFQSGRNGITEDIGFYDLTSTYQTVFTSGSPEAPVDENGDFDAYGVYNDLVIVWEARVLTDVPAVGNISLDIRVTMNDQDLNVAATQGTTTYTSSYTLSDEVIDNSAVFNMDTNVPTFTIVNDFESSNTTAITNITQANPAVVTIADTSIVIDGSIVTITDVVGMTELNGNQYTANILTGTTLQLTGVDSTSFGAYVSGGTLTYQTDDN